jgi:carbonic anhydrase
MSEQLSRRRFLTTSGAGVATAIAAPGTAGALASDSAVAARTSPRQALKLLIDGNRRWVTGKVTHPHQSVARRVALRAPVRITA